VRLGVELVPYMKLEQMVGIAREAERLGYEQLWVCDHYHNRFAYVALSQIALKTSRLRLGPGVTNPYLLHPSVTAAAIATLSELSGGRALLGISAGDPYFLRSVGVERLSPVEGVQDAVRIIRGLLAGGRVSYQGRVFRCAGARLRFKPPNQAPIYIGGRRKRMLELAGELGDGALINASHPEDLKEALGFVRRRGREFDRVAYLAVSVGRDEEVTKKLVRVIVAFIVASAPKRSLETHRIPEGEVEEIRKLLEAGKVSEAGRAVTPRMIEAFSVCGNFASLEERLEEIRRLGFSTAVVGSPIGPEPREVLARAASVGAPGSRG
jgi:5,10-methylenetetrahydromethanopterin reductase